MYGVWVVGAKNAVEHGAAAHAVGHPLVDAVGDEDLFLARAPGQRAGKRGHVGAYGVVVAAPVRRGFLPAVAGHVEDRAQPRRELPVEGHDVFAGRGEVLPPLGANTGVDGDPAQRERVLDEEARALRHEFLRTVGRLERPAVIDHAVRVAGGVVVQGTRAELRRRDRAVAVGVERGVVGGAIRQAVNRTDEPAVVADVADAEGLAAAQRVGIDLVGREARQAVRQRGVGRLGVADRQRVDEAGVLLILDAALDRVAAEQVLHGAAEAVDIALVDRVGAQAAALLVVQRADVGAAVERRYSPIRGSSTGPRARRCGGCSPIRSARCPRCASSSGSTGCRPGRGRGRGRW